MTNLEIRALLDSVDARALRHREGISASTIARALGVTTATVRKWEKRVMTPTGATGASYGRVVSGLIRHSQASNWYLPAPALEPGAVTLSPSAERPYEPN